jgi:hypothetical protein
MTFEIIRIDHGDGSEERVSKAEMQRRIKMYFKNHAAVMRALNAGARVPTPFATYVKRPVAKEGSR